MNVIMNVCVYKTLTQKSISIKVDRKPSNSFVHTYHNQGQSQTEPYGFEFN